MSVFLFVFLAQSPQQYRYTLRNKPICQYGLNFNKQISELLEQSIKSEGVISLFSDVKEETSLFDENFIKRIQKMDEKNLAIEMLHKLLNNEIKGRKYKQNIVKSEAFSEKLTRIMNKYINGHITNQEVIDELIELAKEIIGISLKYVLKLFFGI